MNRKNNSGEKWLEGKKELQKEIGAWVQEWRGVRDVSIPAALQCLPREAPTPQRQ